VLSRGDEFVRPTNKHAAYRKRTVDFAGLEFNPPDDFIWKPLNEKAETDVFDLVRGRTEGATTGIETGHLMHRFLILLCSDFYRPLSICAAFSELFPDENFAQTGSANRVVQIARRLREWFKTNGNRFWIEEREGYYHLKAQAGIGIRVPREMPSLSRECVTWKRMLCDVQPGLFSKHDVVRSLECSTASAERLPRWAIHSGEAEAIGGGPQRRYRLAG
jgi:hypothetical protein